MPGCLASTGRSAGQIKNDETPHLFRFGGFLSIIVCSAVLLFALYPNRAQAGVYSADSEVTYKEYWVPYTEMTGGDTDDPGCADSNPNGTYWLEPWPCEKLVEITIPDNFIQALKVEIYLDLWRNRNKPSARFQINGGLTFTPTVGSEWSRTPWSAEIPKSALVQGVNTLRFWNAHGGHHIHDIGFRIYFDASHPLYDAAGNLITAPEGELVSVWADNGLFAANAGGNLTVDDDQLVLTANVRTAAKFVEFHGHYSGYDEDNNRPNNNDALDSDWHNRGHTGYHPGGLWQNNLGGTIDHIGTAATPRPGKYSIYWNLAHIVSQPAVKFKIRLVGHDGSVREAAGGVSASFAFTRSRQMAAYAIRKFKDTVLNANGTEPITATRTLTFTYDDPATFDQAYFIGAYWENPKISINGNSLFSAFAQGEDEWALSIRQPSLSWFAFGGNEVLYRYSTSWGQFIEKPGPLVILKQTTQLEDTQPPTITSREPAPSATNIAPDANIVVHIADSGRGVNFNRLKLKINGAVVQPQLSGSPDETVLTYDPPLNFVYNSTVSVAVDACDFADKCMATASHTFTVQPVQFTLTANDSGNGQVQIQPGQSAYAPGAVVTLTANPDPGWAFSHWEASSAAAWWNGAWQYRLPITVGAGSYARTDKPVEVALNFTTLLQSMGQNAALDPNSLRVVEVGPFAQLLDDFIPFQFDPAAGFDPTINAAGTLIFLMEGATPANTQRSFYLYFDVAGKDFTLPTFADQVVRSDIIDENQISYQFQSDNATYAYHKLGGGFSSLVDREGNDWLSYHDIPVGAAGSYRGMPNAAYPDDMLHPGKTTATTIAVYSGPLKESFRTVTNDGNWETLWEIYPTYARMTMLKVPHSYWVLYEGTPGGKLETTKDFVMRPIGANGTQTKASQSWSGDLPTHEWVYFSDPTVNRSLFMAHHEEDTVIESYRAMDNAMTVFGFGRNGTNTYLTQVPAHFTVGLIDSTDFASTSSVIYSAYKDVNMTLNAVEQRNANSNLGSSATITLTMTANRVVTATFSQLHYTISTHSQGNGAVNRTPEQTDYTYGTPVTLSATPALGWSFTGWAGDLTGTTNPATLSVESSRVITATFVQAQYTLATPVTGSGAVNANPAQATYLYGDQVTLTAMPQPGWTFSGWSGDVNGSANTVTLTLDGNKTVTANFTQNVYNLDVNLVGTGSVTKNPDQPTYHYGDLVTLTATPPTDWRFAGWSGSVSSMENPLTLPIDSAKTLVATFLQEYYGLTISATGTGSVTRTPDQQTYLYGDVVTVSATPAVGWTFTGWTGTVTGDQNPLALTMSANAVLNARFTQTPYTLAVATIGSGSVTQQPHQTIYATGDTVTLTATPDVGWSFAGWSGSLVGTTNPAALSIDSNEVVTATFVQSQYGLTTNVIGSGTVEIGPKQPPYLHGESVKLTAIPAAGWVFASWSGDLNSAANPATLSINGNQTVTATFVQSQYGVFASVVGEGSVAIGPKPPYLHGAQVKLTASAAEGWVFVGWSGDLTGATNPASLSIDGNKTVTATFIQAAHHALSVLPIGSGQVTVSPIGVGYASGTTVLLTATSDPGWQFVGWRGDLSGNTNPASLLMDKRKVVTATFALVGYRLTLNTLGNGLIQPSPAKAIYFYGDQVTLTALPGSGAAFAGWSGDLTSAASSVTLTVDSSKSVTATFSNLGYGLTTEKVGSGQVTVEPDKPSYTPGEQIKLTAIPAPGWRFNGWSGNLGSTNPLVISMGRDRKVTATFVQESYTLTLLQPVHGRVEIAPQQATYHFGDSVTLTAVPDNGYLFVRWHVQSAEVAAAQDLDDNPLTITVSGNIAYEPEFAVAAPGSQAIYLPIIVSNRP